MALNVVRFSRQGAILWGVLRDGAHHADPRRLPDDPVVPECEHRRRPARPEGESLGLGARSRLLSPVTRNQQFICQGANYRQHMIELGMNPDAKTST